MDLENLSIDELRKIKKHQKREFKKEYSEYKEKQKLIADIKKIKKLRGKIKKQLKTKTKPKTKTFDEYFQECIKNKTIPPDTPSYLRKALVRALKEYNQGIKKEKSALDEFANKYIVKGQLVLLCLSSLDLNLLI